MTLRAQRAARDLHCGVRSLLNRHVAVLRRLLGGPGIDSCNRVLPLIRSILSSLQHSTITGPRRQLSTLIAACHGLNVTIAMRKVLPTSAQQTKRFIHVVHRTVAGTLLRNRTQSVTIAFNANQRPTLIVTSSNRNYPNPVRANANLRTVRRQMQTLNNHLALAGAPRFVVAMRVKRGRSPASRHEQPGGLT